MNILIVGNMGYVGSGFSTFLRSRYPSAKLAGYDKGLFGSCLTGNAPLPESALDVQYYGDVRDEQTIELSTFEAVIYLAAISNDPMGKAFERPTFDINQNSATHWANRAKASGVKRFVFASSCSVYGAGGNEARTENSPVNPLTAYAHSKVNAERDLEPLADSNFSIRCLRFATACGFSPRLRLDLVLNDFVATALATKRIQILSDGSPWRPLIHVQDMHRALDWAAGYEGEPYLKLNVGSEEWNYQIKDLAEEVSKCLHGVDVSFNKDASPDNRSYRVDFSLYRKLASQNQPIVSLKGAIQGLYQGLTEFQFNDVNFRESSPLIRLKYLTQLIESGRLSTDIHWAVHGAS